MSLTETINQWRQLAAEEKLRQKWQAIPLDVAQSMAFEGEPVPLTQIHEILAQIELPALLKPNKAS